MYTVTAMASTNPQPTSVAITGSIISSIISYVGSSSCCHGLRQARLTRHYYNLLVQQYKTGKSRKPSIVKIKAKLESPPSVPTDQCECHILLKAAQLQVRKLRKITRETRQAFLTRGLDIENGGDSQSEGADPKSRRSQDSL
jgi:hypothetical protein